MKNYPRIKRAIARSFSFTAHEIEYIIRDVRQGTGDKPSSELLCHMKRSPKQVIAEAYKFRHLPY